MRVLVVGAGPAGLAAAETLLDRGEGSVQVELHTLGHVLGGKASSWRLEDGRTVEHGQHIYMGFYREMKALLVRAGVDLKQTSISSGGKYVVLEDRDQRSHRLYVGSDLLRVAADGLRYTGFSFDEKIGVAGFLASLLARVAGGVPESLDDICFSAWALANGVPPSVFGTNLFRTSREAQMNWPGEISAYSMLRTLKTATESPGKFRIFYPGGGMSEMWWNPVGARIESLGGSIVRRRKLTALVHDGERLTALRFAHPQPHVRGERYLESIPTLPGSEDLRSDFDAAVVTLPQSALAETMDEAMDRIPGLSGIRRLKSVAPLAMQVWHRNPVSINSGKIVAGLAPPLSFVVDNKGHYPANREDSRYASVLHFAGQLTGFESDDDETLLGRALDSLRQVEGYEAIDRQGVVDFVVHRHAAPHKRYWYSEPGSLRFKPPIRTPLKGLYLAGDWVRCKADYPCMETAVRTGREAALAVLDDLLGKKGSRRRAAGFRP